jgi:S-formylglutathione hydrolase FrmB
MKIRRISHPIAMFVLVWLVFITSCHRKAAPEEDRPRIANGVRMQDFTFHSRALDRDMPYRAFLPKNMRPEMRLPVVYLLHGGNGGFRDWSNYSDVSQYAARGLILVMPEGGDLSYYMNAALKPRDRYEDYIFTDLIADVENRLPAATGRDHRAAIGISMGGFAVIEVALTRPDLFAFVGAFSPSVEVTHRRFNIFRSGQWWRMRSIFGPWGSYTRTSRDPFALVSTADPRKTPFIYMTAGDNEPLLGPDRHFASQLSERHFAHEFHIKPGGHAWDEWDSQISECFESLLQRIELTP